MSEKKESVMTKTFTASFPAVFNPKIDRHGNEKYSITMVFDNEEDIKPLRDLCVKAAKENFKETVYTGKKFKWPFKGYESDDIDLERFPNFEGKYWCDAKSNNSPGLVDQKRNEIIDEKEFYAGCKARAMVNAYTYDVDGNRGVALGLIAVQKVADGERLGGRVDASTFFSEIEVEDEDMDL